jgi:uncharacterized YigZ family protein
MRTIRRAGTHELQIQRSRFICALSPAESAEQATAFIEQVRSTHWSATHHCTAFRTGAHGEQQRSNDDREPAGTAGVPMLQVLTAREITNTVAVVTRYFGGVKLGAGGLVRAYGRSVSEALDAIGVLDLVPHTELTVTVEHAAAGRLEHGLRSAGAEITGIDYAARVTVHLLVPTAGRAALGRWLAQFSGGSADLVEGSQSLRAVPPARPDPA